ncbi:hypothetical protein JM48_2703 [Lactiplantibacillus plantarum]|nr:hypothetical protein JM48_2703 [Lactiplantibacillus plantarum]
MKVSFVNGIFQSTQAYLHQTSGFKSTIIILVMRFKAK